jgi:ABC-type lipoprotein export system ATPase subunit
MNPVSRAHMGSGTHRLFTRHCRNACNLSGVMQSNRLISLRVIGGFLDGLNLVFDTGLTCIIGARGTGKSTILELIRYCLDQLPKKDLSPAARRRVDNLVAGNLGGGRVELEVETSDGVRYFITRAAGEEPMVLDKERNPTGIKVAGFFRAEIFSQNEVEGIADQKRFQLELIDSFASSELPSLDWSIHDLREGIVRAARDTEPLRSEIRTLEEKIRQAPNIRERLKAFTMEGGDSAEEVNKAHAAKALRDREARAVRAAGDAVSRCRAQVSQMIGALKAELTGKFSKDLLEGANAALMGQIVDGLRTASQQVDKHLTLAVETLDACSAAQGGMHDKLNEQHQVQEIAFRELIEKHAHFQKQSTERAGLDRQLNEIMDAERLKTEKEAEIAKLEERQAALLKRLSEERDRRFDIRKKIADRLNGDLSPTIRVTLVQDGDTTGYRELLEEHLKPTQMRHVTVAQRLSESTPPCQLASLVRSGDLKALMEHGDLNPDQAAKVVQAFSHPVRLAELESVDLRDQPTIELQDGSGYKDSATLSTGQKCTTILPILLLESANPLLIDQPEDNLDNRFIFQTVVSKIGQASKNRQLVFITHNPNIPVLGEAGQVVVMESDGDHGGAITSGDVDHCREHIITLLEGGAEAFRQRGNRYKMTRK